LACDVPEACILANRLSGASFPVVLVLPATTNLNKGGSGENPRSGFPSRDGSMMKVAITGNVASGKSTLARIWAREGIPVVSADDLARAAAEPGTPGLRAITEAFGEEVLLPDGTLDRDGLRRLVFRDAALRGRLEEILHPRIAALRDEWMAREAERGSPLVAAEIPLLFELGLEGDFDATVLVHATDEERWTRLVESKGLGEDEARRIMEAQMPAGDKLEQATYVLHNSGSMDELEARALALLDLLRARAAGKGA
jgi:dephospho-CoA kinase